MSRERIEIRWICDGQHRVASFPDTDSAEFFAVGLTQRGWDWEAFKVLRFDFEDFREPEPATASAVWQR